MGLILVGRDEWKNNKLLGYGLGKTGTLDSAGHQYIHNAPAQVLCETGLIGMAFYITMILWGIKAIRNNHQSSILLAMSFLLTMTSGIFISRTFFLFFAIALYGVSHGSENEAQDNS